MLQLSQVVRAVGYEFFGRASTNVGNAGPRFNLISTKPDYAFGFRIVRQFLLHSHLINSEHGVASPSRNALFLHNVLNYRDGFKRTSNSFCIRTKPEFERQLMGTFEFAQYCKARCLQCFMRSSCFQKANHTKPAYKHCLACSRVTTRGWTCRYLSQLEFSSRGTQILP